MNQIDCELAILKIRVEKDTHTIAELQTTVATNLDRIRELEALRSSFINVFPLTCQDAGAGGGPPTKLGKLAGNPHVNKTMQGGGNPLRINPPTQVPELVVDPARVVKVSRIQVNGKIYLKSSENMLYDLETKTEVGIWDPETKTMKDLQEEDDYEEYESKEDEVKEDATVCCSEGQQRQTRKPRTQINRKLFICQYFKHGMVFRASKKHTKNDEIISIDIVYNCRTQTFFDRTTRVEYKTLGAASTCFSKARNSNNPESGWNAFKALNLETGDKRSIEKLYECKWLAVEDLEPYIDHDFMF